jgi:hypothetical protein
MTTIELGECVRCIKEALFSCLRCKRVNYCSIACQVDDQCRGHDEICEPRLGDMFKRFIELYVKDENTYKHDGRLSLSITDKIFCIKGKWIAIELSLPEFICVVCSNDAPYNGHRDGIQFIIYREDLQLHCRRCEDCRVKGRMICKNSLYDNQDCHCHIVKAIYFMLNDVFPLDLTREICILFNKVKCVYVRRAHTDKSKQV